MLQQSETSSKLLMVEGNIGAGKSTFLRIIKKHLDVNIVYEPDQKWQDVADGENLLDKFYKDTQRWAYTFQTYAFVTRVVAQEQNIHQAPGAVQVIERSVFADRYCFAKNCFEMGVMTALEWQLYQEWFSWLVDKYTQLPSGFIYLRTEPQVCYQRVLKRSRSAEKGLSLDYLKMLHQRHEDWLIDRQDLAPSLQNVPVLILDCSIDFEHNEQEQKKHSARVSEFFKIMPVRAQYKKSEPSLTV